jgi:copper(I)-binding protein
VIRSRHRIGGPRGLVVLAIAVLIPALAGCEAGTNAPTQQWHTPTDGGTALIGNIAVKNAFVLGAPIGQTIGTGQSAGVFLAIVNSGGSADRLLSISAPGYTRSVTLPGGSVSLARGQVVLLTGPVPKIVLTDLTRPLNGGSSIRLVLNFQNAGTVGMTVPVMPKAQYYSTFSPPPSPSPSPTVSKHHRATPTATPTPSATATPSPTPSPTATS